MPTRITPMVDISTRCTHLSRASISHRHSRRHLYRHAFLAGTYLPQAHVSWHTSLPGVYLSLACISLENATYSCVSHRRVFHRLCISGVYISQGVRNSWARDLMVCMSRRVSFAGMHLKGLHLIGAYISQNVHLRCLYLIGIALSRARISQACILRLPAVPELCPRPIGRPIMSPDTSRS